MIKMDEKQLIEGCIRGERVAQKALYDRFSRKMMAVCLRYEKNMEDSRDLLQEGFVKVFLNIQNYSGNGSFEGWIRKIFINCALERKRQKNVLNDSISFEEVDNQLNLTDETMISQISADEIMACLQALPDGFRTVFNLFAIEGYSHKEISEMLNIQEGTSRSQYMRARKMLQNMILKHL